MNINIKKSIIITLSVFLIVPIQAVLADEFKKDLSISAEDVKVPQDILKGQSGRIYVTVHNNSSSDLTGVVKFFDESTNTYIGTDQPVSVLSGKTDDVFADWVSEKVGNHPIAVRLIPWDTNGDNPLNNKVTKDIYVDIDSDGDGKGDRLDPDDDNDGVPDNMDAFPLDGNESKDTDRDGIGDNADNDDDNDGTPDIQDAFTTDAKEWKDTDKDGVGDNSDAFPFDLAESKDSDSDDLGDNADPDDNNKGPIPEINISSTEISAGDTITFNAISSRDTDGQINEFIWDFDDGTIDKGVIIDHSFKEPGEYTVSLRVTDNKGEFRDKQILIIVHSGWVLKTLFLTTILLIIMILGLLLPKSRFYHKKLFVKNERIGKNTKKKK